AELRVHPNSAILALAGARRQAHAAKQRRSGNAISPHGGLQFIAASGCPGGRILTASTTRGPRSSAAKLNEC
ncbi:MAG: hypothetical protein ACREDV_00855, partial [Methylocella sp.]